MECLTILLIAYSLSRPPTLTFSFYFTVARTLFPWVKLRATPSGVKMSYHDITWRCEIANRPKSGEKQQGKPDGKSQTGWQAW